MNPQITDGRSDGKVDRRISGKRLDNRDMDRVLAEIEALSENEAQRLLDEKDGSSGKAQAHERSLE